MEAAEPFARTWQVAWRGPESSYEACAMTRLSAGWLLEGTVVASAAGQPSPVSYRVLCDATWHTRDVRVFAWEARLPASTPRVLALESDGAGHWRVNGEPAPSLDGCLDVDLGVTPSTNTLPIRRLRLAVGGSAHVVAAWVRFPDLEVRSLGQRYTRLDERLWRYESDTGFTADLTVDAEGLVVDYPGAWQRAE